MQAIVVPEVRRTMRRVALGIDEDALGVKATVQNLVSLLALWLDDRGPEWLNAELGPYVPRLLAIDPEAAGDHSGVPRSQGEPVLPPPAHKRRKRG